jgi:transcriptional regulator with XRE-family HTH domain
MNHQGEKLRVLITSQKKRIGDVANEMGISRQQLSVLFKEIKLPEKYMIDVCKILKVDRVIFDETGSDFEKNNPFPAISSKDDLFERLLLEKDKRIEILEKLVKTLEYSLKINL